MNIPDPDITKDQFFLTDQLILDKIVDLANLKKTDVVFEIGAGTGNLTQKLAKKALRVIAFEIDKRFKPILSTLPSNVEVHIEDAWNFLQQSRFQSPILSVRASFAQSHFPKLRQSNSSSSQKVHQNHSNKFHIFRIFQS